MKSEHTKGIVQQWFIPIALLIGFLLTYNDILSNLSAKMTAPKVRETNTIKNYNFEEDIQGPIERSKDDKELSKVCTAVVTRALNQSKDLTEMLNKENEIHDRTWRDPIQARWRRDMIEYLEEAAVVSIKVAWKAEELCRLEASIDQSEETTSAIAQFQKSVMERGLKESHLRQFRSQMRLELEAAVEEFNEYNDRRLMHLAGYTYDVTYKRSPIDWFKYGPVGAYLRDMFSGVFETIDMIEEGVQSLMEIFKDEETTSSQPPEKEEPAPSSVKEDQLPESPEPEVTQEAPQENQDNQTPSEIPLPEQASQMPTSEMIPEPEAAEALPQAPRDQNPAASPKPLMQQQLPEIPDISPQFAEPTEQVDEASQSLPQQ